MKQTWARVLPVKKLILPKFVDQEEFRREFILNILLVSSVFLSAIAFVVNIINSTIYASSYHGEQPYVTGIVFIFFCSLTYLSRKGKGKVVSYILVFLLLGLSASASYRWGADLPIGLLLYALITIMAGILIGSKFAFFITFISGLLVVILAGLENAHLLMPDASWKDHPQRIGGAVVYLITLEVMATVSWLYNRETNRALKRATESEQLLQRQKDRLEILVEQRTRQLKQSQLEKISQLYRFAEFGKSASGLFHDLANPLNLISLNLNSLTKDKELDIDKTRQALKRAIAGTKRLEDFIEAARKQIQNQTTLTNFPPAKEISQAIEIVSARAFKAGIIIDFNPKTNLKIYGNPLKFNQLVTNLISNAIDSYDHTRKKHRKVDVELTTGGDKLILKVQDWGIGISQKIMPKIFEPLFTTKNSQKGTGIGLSVCKEIVEKDFKGSIEVESVVSEGTVFIVKI